MVSLSGHPGLSLGGCKLLMLKMISESTYNGKITVMILSFRTHRPVQTQIRLPSLIRVYTVCNSHYSKIKPSCSTFRVITANIRVSEILGILQYILFTV